MARLAYLGLGLLGVAVFLALGIWQIERRAWKLDLIDRVEARVHAAPAAAPGPADWPSVSRDRDEYRHVRVTGHFLDSPETRVLAVTELGGGNWVLAPFLTDRGFVVLVNRGFVPTGDGRPAELSAAPPGGETEINGLLRLSEPGGAFLRANDPGADRWYSRDVAAIAAARGLHDIAPYFIDADADGSGWPCGGLTVIRFHNSHLVYAITWFSLAALLSFGLVLVWRAK